MICFHTEKEYSYISPRLMNCEIICISAFPLTHILFGIDLLILEISFLHYISMENYFLLLLINTKKLMLKLVHVLNLCYSTLNIKTIGNM